MERVRSSIGIAKILSYIPRESTRVSYLKESRMANRVFKYKCKNCGWTGKGNLTRCPACGQFSLKIIPTFIPGTYIQGK